MKSRTIVCALAAASLSMSSLSFAQIYDRDRDGNRDNNRQGYQQRDNDRRDGDRRGYEGRDNDRRDRSDRMGNRGYYRADQYHYNARGPEWRRGGYVPYQYRGNQYVVNDWRSHRLNEPPRGYHWVQVGSDYVLVAIATGLIVQLLLNQ